MKIEVFEKLHEILGDGEVPGCKTAIASGHPVCHNICCEMGSVLLPGEREYLLTKLSEKEWTDKAVFLTKNSVLGCLGINKKGEKYCKMGDLKTITCKIYPYISVISYYDNSFKIIDKKTTNCPASILPQPDKITEAKEIIMKIIKLPQIYRP